MIITHTEFYTFPNTQEGRSLSEACVADLRRSGVKAIVKTTTVSITVGHEETFAFKPHELEVMREPEKEVTNDA